MTAATLLATDPKAEVFLIERNDALGKKVVISGGGRCNVTTGIADVRTVLTKYPRGSKFLSSAMYTFPPEAVRAWFVSHGVPLKCEEDLRVFPVSDDGHDIVHAFDRVLATKRMHVLLGTAVTGVERLTLNASDAGPSSTGSVTPRGHRFAIHIKNGTGTKPEPLEVDNVVLTTGGQAYRHTGSTGDGYAFAVALGHTVTPLAASLNSFFTSERWPADISGLSFERATITSHRGTKPISFTGPFLFTHKGVSGPAVFALSSLVAFETYDRAQPLDITIDLFPDLTLDGLRALIATRLASNPAKQFQNVLGLVVPKSLAEACMALLSAPAPADPAALAQSFHQPASFGSTRADQTPKTDILRVAKWLKAIPLHVIQRGAGDEFVTAGGIPLSEVLPSTMESRICPGLYFAGEILDVDGFTGGFNLQASWATGHLAGESIGTSAAA
ncbi:MAG: hypothetical protein RLZZ324_809 [Candidatus Parcubacteria bacterium]